MSQALRVRCPRRIIFMLKPTVGILSVVNSPPASTRASVVLPAFCRPMIVMSSSVDQRKERSQSQKRRKILGIMAGMSMH